MSQSFGISEFKPLSIGAVVTGAVQLYRDNFKQYFMVALFATLWAFIPIYGTARYAAEAALISRLAFNQISGRSENLETGYSIVNQRKWSFLGAFFLYALYIVLFYAVAFGVGAVLAIALQAANPVFLAIGGLLYLLLFISLLFWIATRYFIQDVTLAVEDGLGASGALKRSWVLTKGSVFRLQLVLLVSTLIATPFLILSQAASLIAQTLLGTDPNLIGTILLLVVFFGATVANGALLTPFWQAVKALIYADLLTRREGVDLELRG
jgi:membrane-anchored glycerophosphoryl diester phosphodiesterase (GDPDase)